ncbi:MAG: VOC family protein [Alphaproteobacteria bacterium]|nr:VOC family protein [Alphaproteobacteria bacterium]
MFAKLNHIAIASDQYAINARFYEALFGLRSAKNYRPARAAVVSDGRVGMNIIPRREGRASGLDHFGLEVEDIDEAIDRLHKFDPSLTAIKRPPVRPFAAYSGHDPDANIFDISQKDIGFQKDVYAEEMETTERHFSHFALRTLHAERCAEFYSEVFELTPLNKKFDDANYYLTDGNMTLAILQWRMADYDDMDPQRLGPDHIGFRVESIDKVKEDIDDLTGQNPLMRTRAMGYGTEGQARLNLFKKCPLGHHHITDIEGVYIDLTEEPG